MRRTPLTPCLLGLLVAVGAAGSSAAEPRWDTEVNVPPLFGLESAEGEAHRGYFLWPLVHWRRVETDREWGLRPLFNLRRDPAHQRVKVDVLWPLICWDRDEANLDWRAFPVMGGWSLNRQWGDPYRYFRIFPLVFLDRSPQQVRHVVFPFAHVRDNLGRDETRFLGLLPFFRLTREGTGEDYVSLFPFGWERVEGEMTGFGAFPLYFQRWGREPRFLAALPLWFQWSDTDDLGRLRRSVQSALGPVFVRDNDVDERRHTVSLLWPLLSWGDGEGYTLRRALPLYSREIHSFSGRDFESHDLFIFPVLTSSHREGDQIYSRRITAPLFWWWWGPDAGERRRDTWGLYPLVNGSQTEGDERQVSVFDPLCFLESTDLHARMAPLWRLFHHRRSLTEPREETEILWRLFRRERDGEHRETHVFPVTVERGPGWQREALLWRLVEHTRDDSGRYLRLLFSPRIAIGEGFGGAPDTASEGAAANR